MEITQTEDKKTSTTNITISLTADELKIFESIVPSAFEWIQTAVTHKVNKCVDMAYEETSDFKADKKPVADKMLHLSSQVLKSRKQKDADDLAEMEK